MLSRSRSRFGFVSFTISGGVLAFLAPQAARAQAVFYDNIGSYTTWNLGGYIADGPSDLSFPTSAPSTVAESFTMPTAYTGFVSFTLGLQNDSTINFDPATVSLFSTDSQGLPTGSALATAARSDINGRTTALYTFAPNTSVSLTAGSNYVVALSTVGASEYVWDYNPTSRNGTMEFANPSSSQKFYAIPNTQVTGLRVASITASATPEPGSIALLGLAGLPAVGMIVRRRRKAV